MKKFFLIPLMTLLTCVMAWGENVAIAQIGETTYYKGDEADAENHIYTTEKNAIVAAFNDATHGQTIELLKNISVSGTITLGNPTERTVTFDLQGKTLTTTFNVGIAVNAGNKLILVNNSASDGCIITTGKSNLYNALYCKDGAELEINEGVVVRSMYANSIKAGSSTGSIVTINGGTLTYSDANTSAVVQCINSTLNIYGGSIIGNPDAGNTTGLAIQAKTSSTVNMTGGTITAGNNKDNTVAGAEAASSVYLQASTLTMTGGEIRSTTTNPALYVDGFSNVAISGTVPTITSTSGDIVLNNGAIVNNIKAKSSTTLTINEGATVSSTSGYAIEATKVGEAIPSITIDGGTVEYVGSTADDVIKCNGATLTMNSGRIESTTKWDAILVNNGSQVTINGGLVTNTSTGAKAYAININANTSGSGDPIVTTLNINGGSIVSNTAQAGYGVSMYGNGATLNMTDGSINATSFAITGNGTAIYGGTTINISGGSLSSATADAAIYHPQAGTLNITGGTITGQTGIGMKGGTLNISGGTIHAVGSNGGRVEGYNNGIYSSFAAVQIESNPDYAGNMNITVSDDATLISDSWYAFYEYTPENKNPQKETKVSSIAVTGGHFQGGILLSQSLAAKGGFVTGGKWTKDISANIKTGENLSLLNNPDGDNPPYLYLVGVPTPAQEADYAEITNLPNTSDPTQNNNAVLTNSASESAASSHTSDNVGDDPDAIDVITTKETNPVVVSENTDVVATEAAPVVEVKKVTVDNDAQLTVTEGATLVVGAGAVTLDENSNNGLTVEAGATLVVDGLIYGSTEDNFVIESQEGKSGIVLFSPETEFIREDHPKATYRFTSKAFWSQAESKWVYQRFGVPTFDGHATLQWLNNPGGGVNSWVKKWDYENDDWTSWTAFTADQLEINDVPPFQGLMLASDNVKPDNTNPAMVYEFTGSLMGNSDANLHFYYGWNYYANSYTAPININEFIQTVKTSLGGSNDILATIYLYQDLGNDTYTWQAVNEFTAGSSTVVGFAPGVGPIYENVPSVINPMQAFLMRLNVEGEANQTIDYADNVYTPATVNTFNPAPARNRVTNNSMQISVFNANGNFDKVFFVENDNFSNDLDNGFDAYKYDGNKGVSLYAMSADKHMEILASNDVDGSFIGINAPEAGNYTLYFSGIQGMNYALIDMTNNTVVTIEEGGQFNFYAEAGQNDYRFQLVAPARVPTAIENVGAKADVKGVYTITGQYLGEDINALPKGVYIINGAKVVK